MPRTPQISRYQALWPQTFSEWGLIMKKGISIRVRLTAFFLIPVIFIVLLGVAQVLQSSVLLLFLPSKIRVQSNCLLILLWTKHFPHNFPSMPLLHCYKKPLQESMAKTKVTQMIAEPVMMSYYGGAYEAGSDEEKQARLQVSMAIKKADNRSLFVYLLICSQDVLPQNYKTVLYK